MDSAEETLMRNLADLITRRRRQSCGRLSFSRPLHQLAKAPRRRIPVKLARSELENEFFPLVVRQVVVRQQFILFEENQAHSQSCALVAVDERLIAAQIKQISRRDFDRIGYQGLSHDCRLRRRHG